jgi:hypothetical protein
VRWFNLSVFLVQLADFRGVSVHLRVEEVHMIRKTILNIPILGILHGLRRDKEKECESEGAV